MKKAKRVVFTLLLTAFEWYLVIQTVNDVTWAANVLKFALWILVILTSLAVVVKTANALTGKPITPMEPTFPRGVLATSDIAIACTLAAYGNFFYATLVLIQAFLEDGLLHGENPKPTKPVDQELQDIVDNIKKDNLHPEQNL